MKIYKFGLMVAVASILTSGVAKADYAVWEDAKSGLKLSYPDTWKPQNNQLPIDVITLSVPSGDDKASCFVRVEEDKRFMMYPNKYRQDIRDLNFSKSFLSQYVTQYDSVNMIRYLDNAGLGQGFASMALLSFTTPSNQDGSPVMDRGGIVAVSNYGDKVFTAECSAYLPAYADYHQQFMSFFKSISFKKYYHESVVGDYRNFINDMGTIDVPFPNAVSRSTY
jgi:hypothetical protein